MHPSKTPTTGPVDRRDFLKTGIAVVVGATAAGTRRAASEEPASVPDQITTRAFGKTGRTLPILLVDHESRLPCGTRNALSGRPFRSSCDEYSARPTCRRGRGV
jgi:hypothetical protein